jgi:hypothetical protein
MPFCTDTDLLYWEPSLFKDAAAAGQTLLSGVASVANTVATFTGLSLTDAGVRPLGVVQFTGPTVIGSFPIVSVDSDIQLTLSVLYDGLFPADGSAPAPSHVGTASNQAFTIRTFFPQRQVVTQLLLQAAGLDPADPDAESSVVNADALRRPCVLGTLQVIYNAMAASATDPARYSARADLYERLYRRSLRSTRVEIDSDGDGAADLVRSLGAIQMLRR